jgi:hypothetical protein
MATSRREAYQDANSIPALLVSPPNSYNSHRGDNPITTNVLNSMKVTHIEPFPVWCRFRNYLLVAVDTDKGISGVGEAGLTGRELAVVGAIEHFKPLLIGQDPARIEHIWQLLSRGGSFPASASWRQLCPPDIALMRTSPGFFYTAQGPTSASGAKDGYPK